MKRLASKKFVNLLLVFALVFTSFPSFFGSSVSADSTVVADDLFISEYIEGSSYNKAIEIYNGTGETVDLTGYRLELYSNGATSASQTLELTGSLAHGEVFVATHTSADQAILNVADVTNSSVINFNGDDAFALVKDETTLDVLGTIGVDYDYAKEVTIVRNPSITVGNSTYTETEWTSYSQNTFDYIGSHTMDGVVTEPGDPGDPSGEVDNIAEAKALSIGTTVTIEGVVTADNATIGGGKISTYIQDETAGINIFQYNPTGYPDLQKGDLVQVTGELDEYNGLLELVPSTPDDVVVISQGNAIPTPQEITLEDMQNESIAEPLEGSLVKVNGFVSSIPSSPAGGGYNISFIDENFNGTTLRVMEGSMDISLLEEGKWYDVTAILSQYNSYQLIPTEASDITLAAEQPEAPSAAGEYMAIVESVTDGDTIRLSTPVLGADRVRFVNMDTPETYHSVNNDLDQNQLDHGLAAKSYIQTLLQPGDQVTLKIGQEATDTYGRLLAQVINEEGKNVNLEMVKQGYAATYFIWPVGDENDYDMFQAAVKEAKDAELGIWNPEDPLLELPFVFRARYDGKGLLRYVGNSDTMEYVVPEKWADVPVEKRVFFASPEEAESAGYTAADPNDPGDPGDPGEDDGLGAVTIQELRDASVGSEATIEGVVTYIDGQNYFIQDETAGIVVRSYNLQADIGDKIKATGETSEYFGMLQLVTDEVQITHFDVEVPTPQQIEANQIGESFEASFIVIEGVTVESVNKYDEFTARDTNGNTFLIKSDNHYVEVGKTYESITGVINYSFGNYLVVPRSSEDVVELPVSSIEEVRKAEVGNLAKVEGVVTYIDGYNYYIQDDTAGIIVRSYDFDAEIGDKIQATGETSEYYGLLQMITDDVQLVEAGVGTPNPMLITSVEMNEPVEGQLVKIENVTIDSVNQYNEYAAQDTYGSFVIDSDSNLIEVGTIYESITGVVTYSFGEYKLIPRFAEDAVKLSFVNNDLSEEDLGAVTTKLVESAQIFGIDAVVEILEVNLTAVVETKGNTKQHVKSAILHMTKSLEKISQGKGNAKVETQKIEHELKKLR